MSGQETINIIKEWCKVNDGKWTNDYMEADKYADKFWGHQNLIFSKQDLERISNGEIFYFDDGEYTTAIMVEEVTK